MADHITLEEHKTIIRSLPVPACLVDRQHHYLSVSKSYAGLFGAAPGDLIGRSMVGIVPDKVIAKVDSDYTAFDNGEATATDEFVINGRIFLVTIHPLRHADTTVIASFVTLTDISPFQKKITDLSGQNEKLLSFNARLQHIAETDPLTGLANRRGMNRFICAEMRRCRREEKPLSLALIDIDYFKHFNDQFGHLAGDSALIQVGAVLQRAVRRPGDYVARYGGEEFIVILPDTDVTGARHVCANIQQAISSHAIMHETLTCQHLTVSIGIAGIAKIGRDIDLDDLREDLLQAADLALYDAKGAGRNSVRVWPDEIGTTFSPENAPLMP